MLPLTYVREIHDLTMFYNILHNRIKVNMDEICNVLVDPMRRRGRTGNIPFYFESNITKNWKYRQFFSNKIIPLWNSLPNQIKQIMPPGSVRAKSVSFIKSLKQLYVNKLQSFDVYNTCTWVTICHCNRCKVH